VLKSGRPPAVLACDAPSTTLAADVVPSGSLITVEAGVAPPPPSPRPAAAAPPPPQQAAPPKAAPTPRPAVPEAAPPPPPLSRMPSEALAPAALETPRSLSHDDAPPAPRRAPQEEWTCGTCTFINVSGATDASLGVELCSVCGTPRMDAVPAAAAPPPPGYGGGFAAARRPVDADGNCLFVALAYLLDGARPEKAAGEASAAKMRRVCAAVVAGDELSYPDAALEKPRSEYGAWIAKQDTWGGALELSILAAHGGGRCGTACSFDDVALVCVDVRTGVDQRYAGPGATRNCYLLFDGVHYDPLVFAPAPG
jgi:hypothetical protein